MGHLYQNKKVLNRVKRIQGQINAVEAALNHEEKSCIDVLQQVAAIKGAVNGLMNELIETHLREHVISNATTNEDELQTFIQLLKRYA